MNTRQDEATLRIYNTSKGRILMPDATFVQLMQNPDNALSWWQLRETESRFDSALKRGYGTFWERAKFEPGYKLNDECAMWQRALKEAEFEWHEICKGGGK